MMRATLRPSTSAVFPTVVSGQGVYLRDADGNEILDGCSGAINCNIGHGVKEIADAAAVQFEKLSFSYRTQFANAPADALSDTLVRLSDGKYRGVWYTNSGSEGIEAAIRFALQYWQEVGAPRKVRILSRRISYHGSTLGALAVSGHWPRRRPLGSLLPSEPTVKPAYPYRAPFSAAAQIALDAADDLERVILDAGAENIAAFVFEPIVGASGAAILPPDGYLERIEEICRAHDVLLIADEVMTGLGRTGRWFGTDHWGIHPDIAVIGKGLNAGYTALSAVLLSERVVGAIENGSGNVGFGHTQAGNPLSAAIANAVVDYLIERDLVSRAELMGARLEAYLAEVARLLDVVGNVRGRGLLWGLEFVADRQTRSPFAAGAQFATKMVDSCRAVGLLVYPSRGFVTADTGDAILVAPPLTINEHEMAILVERLERGIRTVKL